MKHWRVKKDRVISQITSVIWLRQANTHLRALLTEHLVNALAWLIAYHLLQHQVTPDVLLAASVAVYATGEVLQIGKACFGPWR